MILSLHRTDVSGDATLGTLDVDHQFLCYTLERTDRMFPSGKYPVVLTTSERCRRGGLWSPRKDFVLPLIEVPGRSGIRIHAANRPAQLEGCVAVGLTLPEATPGEIHQSRAALILLMEKLAKERTMWLEVT